MAPKRRITTRGEYAGAWAMVVLAATVVLVHANTAVRLWLAGSRVEFVHWWPIAGMSAAVVWGVVGVVRYHRAPRDQPEEETSPAVWSPRER